jgi:cyanophycin synthetase
MDFSPPNSSANKLNLHVFSGKSRFESGYWCGMRQAAYVVELHTEHRPVPATVLQTHDAICRALGSQLSSEHNGPTINILPEDDNVIRQVLQLATTILACLGMPNFGGSTAIGVGATAGQTKWLAGLPAIDPDNPAPQIALQISIHLFNTLLAGASVAQDTVRAQIDQIALQLRTKAPRGINTIRLLAAANALDIPWRHVGGNIYQFGWGSRSRWLDSSFTDQTPQLSAMAARDKRLCAKILRDFGLPVPNQMSVGTADQAVAAARKIGYPVVVKPADLDGGLGVHAGLTNDQQVKNAFADAGKLSKRILVEQFLTGGDFRFQVFAGNVFWAVRRRPAGVIGDGRQSITQLVAALNARRAERKTLQDADHMAEQGREAIVLDAEADIWLAAKGLSMDSVPVEGQRVRLAGAANVSRGGTRQGIELHHIHPDNAALAIDATRLLKLDLAGVDLILPDVTQSWRETGGGICEVNGQPQLAPHLPRQLLPQIVPGQGRIPVFALLLSPESCINLTALRQMLAKDYPSFAFAQDFASWLRASNARHVEAIVYGVDVADLQRMSFPFDRADVLITSKDRVDTGAVSKLKALMQPAQHWLVQQVSGDASSAICRELLNKAAQVVEQH